MSKLLAFARDLGLTAAAALIAVLGPLSVTPGLAQMSGGQWLAVFDHVASAVVLAMGALVITPLTKEYGLGSGTSSSGDLPVVSS